MKVELTDRSPIEERKHEYLHGAGNVRPEHQLGRMSHWWRGVTKGGSCWQCARRWSCKPVKDQDEWDRCWISDGVIVVEDEREVV